MAFVFKLSSDVVGGVPIGSLRYGHYGLRTTVIHGKDLVQDLLHMLNSTWVS